MFVRERHTWVEGLCSLLLPIGFLRHFVYPPCCFVVIWVKCWSEGEGWYTSFSMLPLLLMVACYLTINIQICEVPHWSMYKSGFGCCHLSQSPVPVYLYKINYKNKIAKSKWATEHNSFLISFLGTLWPSGEHINAALEVITQWS